MVCGQPCKFIHFFLIVASDIITLRCIEAGEIDSQWVMLSNRLCYSVIIERPRFCCCYCYLFWGF